jgi:serralysin
MTYTVPNFGPSNRVQIVRQLLQGGTFTLNGINYYGATNNIDALWYNRSSLNYAINNVNAALPESAQISGFVTMTQLMQSFAATAFELWDDIISLSLNPTTSSVADMALNFANNMSLVAYAQTVGNFYTVSAPPLDLALTDSNIWINANAPEQDSDSDYFWGSRGFFTFLHEIGHSLGLQHGGNYDAVTGNTYTYSQNAEYVEDTARYTVMSYFAANDDNSGTDHVGSNNQLAWGATPLLHDIYVLQAVYGADMTTRTGNTTYGFNSNANRDVFNFVLNPNPVVAIWDAGGVDTLDASGFSTNQTIRLLDGNFSSIGHMTNNVAIAYNAIIENGIGGSGNDIIIGNLVSNRLEGRAGADQIDGLDGNDSISGGDGNDIIYGGQGNDVIDGDAGIDYIAAGSGADTINGGADPDEIYGEDGDDTINGGLTFSTDILVGGAGNDVIYGNSGLGDYDRLFGNAGNDTFYIDTPDDLVFEQPGEGYDIVYANINGGGFYMYDNIEDTILLGNTPFVQGNALANRLTGSATANTLLGGAGNDTLNGMAGNDVLWGEAGADTFVFSLGAGTDTIGDFQRGVDRIDLRAFGFTSFAAVQSFFNQVGTNGAIEFGSGEVVILNGIQMNQLTAADFII